jgi:hypothetical protein
MQTCDICYVDFENMLFESHVISCMAEQKDLLTQFNEHKSENNKSETKKKIYDFDKLNVDLTDIQTKAVKFFTKKSKVISVNMYLLILARFKFLGYTEDDMKLTIEYFKKVPAIIHVSFQALQFLIKDTHYRNQFETKTSRGALSESSRLDWEKNLFDGIYDKSTGPEKVKYGAVNVLSDQFGVKTACPYGECYFQLKESVKSRISFVNGDSSCKQLHICSFRYMVQMLYYIDDNLFKTIIDKALGKSISTDMFTKNYMYIELQVHGPIRLSEDIEKLVIPSQAKNDDIDLAMKFCSKNKINLDHY